MRAAKQAAAPVPLENHSAIIKMAAAVAATVPSSDVAMLPDAPTDTHTHTHTLARAAIPTDSTLSELLSLLTCLARPDSTPQARAAVISLLADHYLTRNVPGFAVDAAGVACYVPAGAACVRDFDDDLGAWQQRLALAEACVQQALAEPVQLTSAPAGGTGKGKRDRSSPSTLASPGVSTASSASPASAASPHAEDAAYVRPPPASVRLPTLSDLALAVRTDPELRAEMLQLVADVAQPGTSLTDSRAVAARVHRALVRRDRAAICTMSRAHEISAAAGLVEAIVAARQHLDRAACEAYVDAAAGEDAHTDPGGHKPEAPSCALVRDAMVLVAPDSARVLSSVMGVGAPGRADSLGARSAACAHELGTLTPDTARELVMNAVEDVVTLAVPISARTLHDAVRSASARRAESTDPFGLVSPGSPHTPAMFTDDAAAAVWLGTALAPASTVCDGADAAPPTHSASAGIATSSLVLGTAAANTAALENDTTPMGGGTRERALMTLTHGIAYLQSRRRPGELIQIHVTPPVDDVSSGNVPPSMRAGSRAAAVPPSPSVARPASPAPSALPGGAAPAMPAAEPTASSSDDAASAGSAATAAGASSAASNNDAPAASPRMSAASTAGAPLPCNKPAPSVDAAGLALAEDISAARAVAGRTPGLRVTAMLNEGALSSTGLIRCHDIIVGVLPGAPLGSLACPWPTGEECAPTGAANWGSTPSKALRLPAQPAAMDFELVRAWSPAQLARALASAAEAGDEHSDRAEELVTLVIARPRLLVTLESGLRGVTPEDSWQLAWPIGSMEGVKMVGVSPPQRSMEPDDSNPARLTDGVKALSPVAAAMHGCHVTVPESACGMGCEEGVFDDAALFDPVSGVYSGYEPMGALRVDPCVRSAVVRKPLPARPDASRVLQADEPVPGRPGLRASSAASARRASPEFSAATADVSASSTPAASPVLALPPALNSARRRQSSVDSQSILANDAAPSSAATRAADDAVAAAGNRSRIGGGASPSRPAGAAASRPTSDIGASSMPASPNASQPASQTGDGRASGDVPAGRVPNGSPMARYAAAKVAPPVAGTKAVLLHLAWSSTLSAFAAQLGQQGSPLSTQLARRDIAIAGLRMEWKLARPAASPEVHPAQSGSNNMAAASDGPAAPSDGEPMPEIALASRSSSGQEDVTHAVHIDTGTPAAVSRSPTSPLSPSTPSPQLTAAAASASIRAARRTVASGPAKVSLRHLTSFALRRLCQATGLPLTGDKAVLISRVYGLLLCPEAYDDPLPPVTQPLPLDEALARTRRVEPDGAPASGAQTASIADGGPADATKPADCTSHESGGEAAAWPGNIPPFVAPVADLTSDVMALFVLAPANSAVLLPPQVPREEDLLRAFYAFPDVVSAMPSAYGIAAAPHGRNGVSADGMPMEEDVSTRTRSHTSGPPEDNQPPLTDTLSGSSAVAGDSSRAGSAAGAVRSATVSPVASPSAAAAMSAGANGSAGRGARVRKPSVRMLAAAEDAAMLIPDPEPVVTPAAIYAGGPHITRFPGPRALPQAPNAATAAAAAGRKRRLSSVGGVDAPDANDAAEPIDDGAGSSTLPNPNASTDGVHITRRPHVAIPDAQDSELPARLDSRQPAGPTTAGAAAARPAESLASSLKPGPVVTTLAAATGGEDTVDDMGAMLLHARKELVGTAPIVSKSAIASAEEEESRPRWAAVAVPVAAIAGAAARLLTEGAVMTLHTGEQTAVKRKRGVGGTRVAMPPTQPAITIRPLLMHTDPTIEQLVLPLRACIMSRCGERLFLASATAPDVRATATRGLLDCALALPDAPPTLAVRGAHVLLLGDAAAQGSHRQESDVRVPCSSALSSSVIDATAALAPLYRRFPLPTPAAMQQWTEAAHALRAAVLYTAAPPCSAAGDLSPALCAITAVNITFAVWRPIEDPSAQKQVKAQGTATSAVGLRMAHTAASVGAASNLHGTVASAGAECSGDAEAVVVPVLRAEDIDVAYTDIVDAGASEEQRRVFKCMHVREALLADNVVELLARGAHQSAAQQGACRVVRTLAERVTVQDLRRAIYLYDGVCTVVLPHGGAAPRPSPLHRYLRSGRPYIRCHPRILAAVYRTPPSGPGAAPALVPMWSPTRVCSVFDVLGWCAAASSWIRCFRLPASEPSSCDLPPALSEARLMRALTLLAGVSQAEVDGLRSALQTMCLAAVTEAARRRAAALVVELSARGFLALAGAVASWVPPDLTAYEAADAGVTVREHVARLADAANAPPSAQPEAADSVETTAAAMSNGSSAVPVWHTLPEWRTLPGGIAATLSCVPITTWQLPFPVALAEAASGGVTPQLLVVHAPLTALTPHQTSLLLLQEYIVQGVVRTALGQRLVHPAGVVQYVVAHNAVLAAALASVAPTNRVRNS